MARSSIMRDESLAFLASIGDLVAGTESADHLLDAVCRLVVIGLADGCIVDLLEPDQEMARTFVTIAEPDRQRSIAASRRSFPLRRGALPRIYQPVFDRSASVVLDPGDPLLAPGGPTDPLPDPFCAAFGIARLIAVPLLAGRQLLGVLTIMDWDIAEAFVPEIVILAEETARHVAVAVEWSRSREAMERELAARRRMDGELRQNAARQATLAALGAAALQMRDQETLFEETMRAIREDVGLESAVVALIEPDGHEIKVRRSSDAEGVAATTVPLDRAGSFLSFALASENTIVCTDVEHETRFETAKLRALNARSVLCVPLRDRSTVLGAIGGYSSTLRAYTTEDIHFVRSLGFVLATGLARHRQEDALRLRQRELEALIEGAPDMIWRLDADGRYVYVNAAVEQLGIPRTAYFGRTVSELGYPPEVSSALQGALARALETGREVALDFDFPRPADIRTFQARLVPQIGHDGVALGVLCVNRDVTEQRRAIENRIRSGDLLRMLIENVSELIIVLDPSGAVEYASPAVEPVLGVQLDGAIGRQFADLVASEDRPSLRAAILALGESGERQHVEIRPAQQRPPRFLEAIASRARLEGEHRIVLTLRDVTARRALEQQVRESQKMDAIGRLAGGVAHDFNNLLTVISSSTRYLLESVEPDDPRREDLDEIEHASQRAAALTRQLLLFSRRGAVQPRVLDVNDLLRSAERMFRRLIGEDLEIEAKLAARGTTIRADPGEIEQVLLNLVVNARDAMPQGGVIRVSTRDVPVSDGQPAMVCIAVSDQGVGIAPDVMGRIFEPFFTTKPPGKGTGLGLSTVYGIVQKAGGRVRVESMPGAGSTFEVFLPAHLGAVVEHIAMPPATRGGSETILVAEDDPAVRRLARRALEDQGYCVLEATDGESAFATASSNEGRIDLLLTDVVMPRLNGRELVARLHARRPELRVLFMSGYTDDEILRGELLESGTELLQKPFTPEVLAWRVRQVLDAGIAANEVRDPGLS